MSRLIGIPRRLVLVVASTAFVLSWSSGFLIAKVGTIDTNPLTLILWRFVLVVGLLAAASLAATLRGRFVMPAWRDVRPHLAIGIFAQFGYVVPIYLAISAGVSSGTTALIDAVQPLVAATLVGPLLGLRVRGLQWLGLVLGAIGVLFIVWADASAAASSPTAAYLLPLLSLASLVTATFLERRTSSNLALFPTLTVHAVVTLVAVGILAACTNAWIPPSSATFWLATFTIALIPTLTAYALYWYLLRRLGITGLNALLFLVAPVTSLLGALLFGETFTIGTAAGLVLGAAAITLVLVNPHRSTGVAWGGRAGKSSEVPTPAKSSGQAVSQERC